MVFFFLVVSVELDTIPMISKRGEDAVLWSRSRPEPDFLAGAEADEKGSGSGLLLFGLGVPVHTQIERKNRYT